MEELQARLELALNESELLRAENNKLLISLKNLENEKDNNAKYLENFCSLLKTKMFQLKENLAESQSTTDSFKGRFFQDLYCNNNFRT
jgi:hypothetical protein